MYQICQIQQFIKKSDESIQAIRQAGLELSGASQPYDKTYQLVEHLYESVFGLTQNNTDISVLVSKLLTELKKVKQIVRQNEKRFATFEQEYKCVLRLGQSQVVHFEDAQYIISRQISQLSGLSQEVQDLRYDIEFYNYFLYVHKETIKLVKDHKQVLKDIQENKEQLEFTIDTVLEMAQLFAYIADQI